MLLSSPERSSSRGHSTSVHYIVLISCGRHLSTMKEYTKYNEGVHKGNRQDKTHTSACGITAQQLGRSAIHGLTVTVLNPLTGVWWWVRTDNGNSHEALTAKDATSMTTLDCLLDVQFSPSLHRPERTVQKNSQSER